MEISIEQCRENDLIKKIISQSKLPIKLIKILLRLSDTIYINAINYNVFIEENKAIILLISSKPENESGKFHTIPLSNILLKLREIEMENEEIKTQIKIENNMIQITVNIQN